MRLGIWIFGIALMALPLFASIVVSPARFPDLFSLEKLVNHYREIVFFGIGVGAIAIAEAADFWRNVRTESDWRHRLAGFVGFVLIIEVVVCGIWYGGAYADEISITAADVRGMLIFNLFIGVQAFVLKLLLWTR